MICLKTGFVVGNKISCGYGFLVQLDKFDICLYIWLILPVGYLCLNVLNFKLSGEN